MASRKKNENRVPRTIRTPLAEVKERFESKENLIKTIGKLTAKNDLLVDRFSEKGLEHVSNAKLLRLHDLVTEVSEQFKNREALVDAYLELRGHGKDEPYKQKVMGYPLGKLYDMYKVARRTSERRKRVAGS